MDRFKVILDNRKRALGSLAVLLAAVGVVVGSGADFTASSANPNNTFTAGTLSMSNSKNNEAILTASNLRPGGPAQSGTVDIQNTGSLSGAFTVERGTVTETDPAPTNGSGEKLATKLNLVVTDCGLVSAPNCGTGTQKYSGTLAGFNQSGSPLALSTFAANEARQYRFAISLDSSAGDSYQGDSSSVTFTWKAAS